jgi:hypothetical protein
MHMLDNDDIETIRYRPRSVQYGDVECIVARRAQFCRCCGETIKKGEMILTFAWDFSYSQSGSWTAQMCAMHVNCDPAPYAVYRRNSLLASLAASEKLVEKYSAQLEAKEENDRTLPRTIRALEKEIAKQDRRVAYFRLELKRFDIAQRLNLNVTEVDKPYVDQHGIAYSWMVNVGSRSFSGTFASMQDAKAEIARICDLENPEAYIAAIYADIDEGRANM